MCFNKRVLERSNFDKYLRPIFRIQKDLNSTEIEKKGKMANIVMIDIVALQRVLQYLSLLELYNFANTHNDHLCCAAVLQFRLRFRNREICISNVGKNVPNTILFDCYLNGFHLVLNFLHIFGREIKLLTLSEHKDRPKEILTVVKYISTHCVSLNEFNFCCLKTDITAGFLKPLRLIHSVSFFQCQISDNLCGLRHWFPNLRFLSFLGWNYIQNYDKMIVRYPFLERMALCHSFIELKKRLNAFAALNNNVQVCYFEEDYND